MAKWEQLRDKLEEVLGVKAWFQPSSDVYLTFPCVVFKLNRHVLKHADNRVYSSGKQYAITIITSDSETDLPDRLVENFPTSRFDRMYTADGLYHYVYELYF